ncbi:hypothetical protein IQ268_08485 [Oculatella sp. LEGE 06141]|uniref:hypothetical protein n=1 Tax=Oculatella sp. LEGE 06141 TaxID=1828648 RepID=UPI0018804FF6|nr:hypothetical protein [Oculatella sp. LEGE 06141]MBE9178594.1 hypothetical protein [Oculatella sp. LEGE 06141]
MFNGFGGKDSKKLEPWELLPFPSEAKVHQRRLSDRTAQVLAEAILASKLPPNVVAVIGQFEEVVELVEAEDDE